MSLRLEPGGQITIVFDDRTTCRLRPPTYGEYRDLRVAQARWWDDLPEADQYYRRTDALDVEVLDWWTNVAKTLTETGAFPDGPDLYPVWMCRVETVTAALQHWRDDPLAPGPAATPDAPGQDPSPAPSTTSSPQ